MAITGRLLNFTRQTQTALTALLRAKRIHPRDPELYYDIAQLYLRAGRKKRALQNFENSLSIRPENKEACLASLLLYVHTRRVQTAFATLRRTVNSLRETKNNHEFFVKAGNFYFKYKEYDEAQKTYRKAIESQPRRSGAYLKLAGVLRNLKKYRNEELVYQELLQKIPSYAQGHRFLGLLYHREMKMSKKAKQHLEKYISLKPNAPDMEEIHQLLKSL